MIVGKYEVSPLIKISAAEIASIMDLEWKDFLTPGVQMLLPAADGESLAEESWWYFRTLVGKFGTCELTEELARRYHCIVRKDRIEKGVSYPNVKVWVGDLCQLLDCRKKTLRLRMQGANFPNPDGNSSRTDHFNGNWWWANTLEYVVPSIFEVGVVESGRLVLSRKQGE